MGLRRRCCVYSVEVAGHPTAAARTVKIVVICVIASAEFVIIRVELGVATASPAAAAAAIAWDGIGTCEGLGVSVAESQPALEARKGP